MTGQTMLEWLLPLAIGSGVSLLSYISIQLTRIEQAIRNQTDAIRHLAARGREGGSW